MTAIAIGASATVTVNDIGSVSVASNGGFGTVSITAVGEEPRFINFGPEPLRRNFGVFREGARVVISNTSCNSLEYDAPNSGGVAMPFILAQTAVPTILLSSATTITATGAISGLTALPFTPVGLVQVYCYAQAGLAAGLYPARFSSASACQIYTDAAGTVTPTGITAGAYAGGTTSAVLATVTVPGGAIGANGALRKTNRFTWPSNANGKIIVTQFAGVTMGDNATYTATMGISTVSTIRNRGVTNAQVTPNVSGDAATANAMLYQSTDTSVSQNITLTGYVNVATDYLILEGYTIEVLPG